MMKPSPTGFQVAFLLFALAFAAMLATRWLAGELGLPHTYFSTLGNLIAFPFELALVLCIPALRQLVREGFRHPFPPSARAEAVVISGLKIALTFGVWGAVAVWGIHVTQAGANVQAYGFLLDRHAMDERYFSGWGLARAALAVTLGPLAEEIIYRGVLFRLWEQQWGWVAGALLSSLVFAAIHPHNVIQTFLSAILYACLYRRTGSLWATTLCHALYNFLVTWPLLGHVLALKPADAAANLAPWLPNLACLALGTIGFAVYVRLAARTPAPR